MSAVITTSGTPEEGQSFSLTCEIRGAERLAAFNRRFRWDEVGATFGILRETTLTFNSLSLSDTGTYQCTHNFASPYLIETRTVTDTVTVTVNPLTATLVHSGTTYVAGENHMLTCQVSGGGSLTYRWFRNGSLLTGEISATLSFSPLRETDNGIYTCETTRTSASVNSTGMGITVVGEYGTCQRAMEAGTMEAVLGK